jgi:anti-anti-sigma factor
MEIVKTQDGGKIVLTLTGRLDAVTAPQLQGALLPAFDDGMLVELDFANLRYVSSAGLRVLILGEKTAKSKKAIMSLVNVPQEVKAIFDITGITEILKIRG